MMIRYIRVAIILTVVVFSLSRYVKAQDTAIDDFYRDNQFPLVFTLQAKPVNLKFNKESNGIEYKERGKTLKKDFPEFTKDILSGWAMMWIIRAIYDPQNFKMVVSLHSIPNMIYNSYGWQNCSHAKALRHLCSPERKPFWAFPLWDGDAVHTNMVNHPVFGAGVYLYYRQLGYSRAASTVASATISALYKYNVEIWQHPPSLNDLFITPGLGVPLGIVLEETSNLLAKSDSQFMRALSYALNPAKILIPDRHISVDTLLGRTIALQFDW